MNSPAALTLEPDVGFRRAAAWAIDALIPLVLFGVVYLAGLTQIKGCVLDEDTLTYPQECPFSAVERVEQADGSVEVDYILDDGTRIPGDTATLKTVVFGEVIVDKVPPLGYLVPLGYVLLTAVVLQGLTGFTPGKLAVGLRLASEEGRAPGVLAAAKRWLIIDGGIALLGVLVGLIDGPPLVRLLALNMALGLAGGIYGLLTDGRRTGDHAAHTMVIDEAFFLRPERPERPEAPVPAELPAEAEPAYTGSPAPAGFAAGHDDAEAGFPAGAAPPAQYGTQASWTPQAPDASSAPAPDTWPVPAGVAPASDVAGPPPVAVPEPTTEPTPFAAPTLDIAPPPAMASPADIVAEAPAEGLDGSTPPPAVAAATAGPDQAGFAEPPSFPPPPEGEPAGVPASSPDPVPAAAPAVSAGTGVTTTPTADATRTAQAQTAQPAENGVDAKVSQPHWSEERQAWMMWDDERAEWLQFDDEVGGWLHYDPESGLWVALAD